MLFIMEFYTLLSNMKCEKASLQGLKNSLCRCCDEAVSSLFRHANEVKPSPTPKTLLIQRLLHPPNTYSLGFGLAMTFQFYVSRLTSDNWLLTANNWLPPPHISLLFPSSSLFGGWHRLFHSSWKRCRSSGVMCIHLRRQCAPRFMGGRPPNGRKPLNNMRHNTSSPRACP